MNLYRVELRAEPDTPEEEERSRRQGRTLGPQTVFYRVGGTSPADAELRALEIESRFRCRKSIWVSGPTVEVAKENTKWSR